MRSCNARTNVPTQAPLYLREGRRVDHVHSDHLFQVVQLAPFRFRVQGQEVIDSAGAGRDRMSPPDTLRACIQFEFDFDFDFGLDFECEFDFDFEFEFYFKFDFDFDSEFEFEFEFELRFVGVPVRGFDLFFV